MKAICAIIFGKKFGTQRNCVKVSDITLVCRTFLVVQPSDVTSQAKCLPIVTCRMYG